MPSNAMLAVPAKGSAESLDLNGSIKKYITSEFGRGSAEDGSSSLQKAQKLRDSVAQMAGGAEEVKQALLGYQKTASDLKPVYLHSLKLLKDVVLLLGVVAYAYAYCAYGELS
jgi:hypothetical protein